MLFTFISDTGYTVTTFKEIAQALRKDSHFFNRWSQCEEPMEEVLFDWLRLERRLFPEDRSAFNILVNVLISYYQGGDHGRHFQAAGDYKSELDSTLDSEELSECDTKHCRDFWFAYRASVIRNKILDRPVRLQKLCRDIGLVYRGVESYFAQVGKR
jgi:hypothetical protein